MPNVIDWKVFVNGHIFITNAISVFAETIHLHYQRNQCFCRNDQVIESLKYTFINKTFIGAVLEKVVSITFKPLNFKLFSTITFVKLQTEVSSTTHHTDKHFAFLSHSSKKRLYRCIVPLESDQLIRIRHLNIAFVPREFAYLLCQKVHTPFVTF